MSKIEKFDGGNRGPKIIGANEVAPGPMKTLDAKTRQEQPPVEVRSHEEIIVEDQGRVRVRKDGEFDLRFRQAKDRAEWDRVRRLEED